MKVVSTVSFRNVRKVNICVKVIRQTFKLCYLTFVGMSVTIAEQGSLKTTGGTNYQSFEKRPNIISEYDTRDREGIK